MPDDGTERRRGMNAVLERVVRLDERVSAIDGKLDDHIREEHGMIRELNASVSALNDTVMTAKGALKASAKWIVFIGAVASLAVAWFKGGRT